MSKKKRRKKNNREKKVFNKNLLIKEEIEARKEVESKIIEKQIIKEAEKPQLDKNQGDLDKKIKDIKKVFLDKFNRMRYLKGGFLLNTKKLYKKIGFNLKKGWKGFCFGMTCKNNLKRDVIITSIVIVLAVLFLWVEQYTSGLKNKLEEKDEAIFSQEDNWVKFEDENIQKIKDIQDKINIDSWKEYKSDWYGFKLKYPQNWNNPTVRQLSKDSKEVFRVSFAAPSNENYTGFDVVVYDVNKTKDFFQTVEFPGIKNQDLKNAGQCENIQGHLLETGDYPAEEVYIPATDDCYNPVLFFSLVDGQYMYNLVPITKAQISSQADPMVGVNDNLPEFFAAISQFENIDIVRPKPKTAQPKIIAPKPASYKVVNGKMVCAKKNDKPNKSDKHKKKHLDMECCLDPDEYPNPNCYYDPNKYGKYLK